MLLAVIKNKQKLKKMLKRGLQLMIAASLISGYGFAQITAASLETYAPQAPKVIITGKDLIEFPPIPECLNT